MTYKEAIIKVMKENGESMHYLDIANEIKERKLVDLSNTQTFERSVSHKLSELQHSGLLQQTSKGTYKLLDTPAYKTTYDVFEAWEERCLKDSKSLLFDEPDLWTEENLKIVIEKLLGNLDTSSGSFEEKIERQFRDYDKSHKIWLMLCELSALHYCPTAANNLLLFGKMMRERSDYERLKNNMEESIRYTRHCAKIGRSYNNEQWFSFGYYSCFALKYKKDEELRTLIEKLRQGDPCWETAENDFGSGNIIESKYLQKGKPVNQKNTSHPQIALNMFCRERYYRMFADRDRKKCISHFSSYLDGDTHKSENQKIYTISEELKKEHPEWDTEESEASYSSFINFYHDPLKSLWKPDDEEETETDFNLSYIETLKQFGQLILQGPPGTGKTYTAKEITKNLIGINWREEQGQRWEIIQFHPSYNYEDFVRGIQIKTKNGQAVYETVNRVLAEMAEKAIEDEDPENSYETPYILIIDEINRANVAAVLGELIYALEYRGEPVKTTYSINGNAEIVLPENLYIIGTMNTADRTIGHIDYAVRRRFAFKTLSPEREVVEKESKADSAVELFDMVAKLFKGNEFLSQDYHPEDVAIGHSYFLAENNEKLKRKIEYQVIPILEEYVKDGVLLEEANKEIEKIKDYFSNSGDLPRKWTIRKTGDKQYDPPLNKTVLEIIKSYVKEKRPKNIEELKKVFPDDTRPPFGVVQLRNDPKYKHFIMENGQPHHENYFVNDLLVLSDGNKIMVCNQWGASGQIKEYWERFTDRAKEQGYEIQIEEM